MRITDIILTAGTNLLRNKTRSILTIIAIFIGTVTLTMTSGIGDGVKTYLDNQISSMGEPNILITMQKSGNSMMSGEENNGPQEYDPTKLKSQSSGMPSPGGSGLGASFLITAKDIEKIKAEKDVVSIDTMLKLSIDYITVGGKKYVIEASPLPANISLMDFAAGKSFDASNDENQIILPSSYISVLGFSDAQNAINKDVEISVSDQNQNKKLFNAKIAGVANKSLVTSDMLMLDKQFSEKAVEFQSNGKPESQKNVHSAVMTKYRDDLSEAEIIDLKDRLGALGYSAKTIKDQQQLVFSVIDGIVLVLNMFGAVALIAASFGIINTLFMAVQERTKEIGLMKAVGMGRGKIFALFSIEAAFLGFWGSAIGVIVASGLGSMINKVTSEGILKDLEGLQLLTFRPGSILIIIGVIVLIAFLAGTLPARKASNLDPIQALRYE